MGWTNSQARGSVDNAPEEKARRNHNLDGAAFSLMVGQLGMRMAVQGNFRVASAAMRNFGDALRIAYRSGTVTGMLTDGLGLLGGTPIFIVFSAAAPDVLLGFDFGGTLLATFMSIIMKR